MSKLQDLIIQYFDEDEEKEIYDQIIHEIQTCDTLWTTYSPRTRNHYVDFVQGRPVAFLFSEKEYCDTYCEHMKEDSNVTVGAAECSKEDRLQLFADYHRSGFEAVIADNGKRYLFIPLEDLINIPDYSSVPLEKRPIINPQLVCSADRLFQCIENNTITPDKELNLLVDTYRAKFLIPVQGEIEGSSITLPTLERSDGAKVVPFFTDIGELRKFDKEENYRVAITEFKQIEEICGNDEIVVINPLGFNFTIDKNTVEAIKNAAASVPDADHSDRAVIYTLPNPPKEFLDDLSTVLDTTQGVEKAYCKGIRSAEGDGLLIVVDCGESDVEETKEILDSIRAMADESLVDTSVQYIAAATNVGRTASDNSEPFFERIFIDATLDPENVD